MHPDPLNDLRPMPARPIFHKELGGYLAQLREARNWSQTKTVSLAKRRGLTLGLGSLRFLEDGKTRHPDAEVLRALATLYELSFTELAAKYVAANYGLHVGGESVASTENVAPARGTLEAPDPPAFRYVAVMKDRIAAGQPLAMEDGNVDSAIAFSERSLRKWKRPLCVRVGKGEESMIGAGIMPNDVVLLECSDEARLNPTDGRIYAVRIEGGATLKKVEVLRDGGRTWLALMSENPNKEKYGTRLIPVNEDDSLLDYIIGRVVWHGQYL